MSTATVTIGRNVDDQPMSDVWWTLFRKYVVSSVSDASTEIYFTGEGQGGWDGEGEAAFTVVFALRPDAQLLELRLSTLAEVFHQDAIAFTVGETNLVTPS